MYSEFLIAKYGQLFSEEVIASFGKPIEHSIRINTLRTSEEELIPRLEKKGIKLERIPWTKYGYFVKSSPFSIGATTEYLLGYYFIQDATSMYACEVLEPKHSDAVLDMTAAPGGKTTYLAQLMRNGGSIVSVELNRERMKSLRSNISRMGVENVIAIRMNALTVRELGIKFDKILLDAPCTGTGTLFKNPEAAKKTSQDVANCTAAQKALLEAAFEALLDGGTLVYTTCSFLPEENEFIVQHALGLGLKLENVPYGEKAFTSCYGKELSEEMRKARRFYPHIHGTQGFFIAKLRKYDAK